jgi:hypothetical protein
MIDLSEIEPYLAGMISDVLAAGGVVGGVRIGGGLWIGAVDQAPDVGDLYLEGSIRYSQAVAARLSLGAAAAVANGTWAALPWDTADLNEAGMWVAGSPGLITCLVDGLYLAQLNVSFAANNAGIRMAGIRFKGSTYLAKGKVFNPSAAESTAVSVGVLVPLAAGETIEGMVYQNSGGGLNAETAETNIAVVRIA